GAPHQPRPGGRGARAGRADRPARDRAGGRGGGRGGRRVATERARRRWVWLHRPGGAGPVSEERFAAGTLIAGRYEVRGQIGIGPAYVDYRVFDREVEVELSLWWMDPALWPDQAARQALVEDAREVRALTHPNLRRVFEAG